MNPDGSDARAVSPAAARAIHPAWPAERIIYCTDDDLQPPRKNDSDIDVLELATGKLTTLITGGVNTYPAWSPDMKHLVFRRMLGEMNSEIFLADGDGRNARNLTNHPQQCAPGREYRGPCHSAALVARWENHLFHQLRREGLRHRLRNSGVQVAPVSSYLVSAPDGL
jgi:hypothetical protein